MNEYRILVVEDNDDDYLLFLNSLKRGGLKADCVRVETIAALSEKITHPESDFDIVITDFSLAGFTGFDVLSTIHHLRRDLPVIVISGTVGEDTAVQIMRSGAQDYVMKDNMMRLGEAIKRECLDRAEKRRLGLALKAKEEELRHAQKLELLGSLAGGVAHDFNNFLSVVMMSTDLALEKLPEKSEAKEHVARMQRAAERAASLTRQLLLFCRKQILEERILDANEVVKHTRDLLRNILGEQISFDVQLCEKPLYVKMDRGQLEQVLMNLVVNARDAMPKGGVLKITTEVSPDHRVLIRVSDTGVGMAEEVKKQIFEPFFTTKGPSEGTGLGLSIVFGIVHHCSGTIDVESSPGTGSTFTVNLPEQKSL